MKKTKIIETYLDGSMIQEERDKMDVLLCENEELSSELELYKNINESITDTEIFDFRSKIVALSGKKNTKQADNKSRIMKKLKYPVAAAILILIGLSLYQTLVLKSSGEIYQMYYEPYQTDLSTRSAIHSGDKVELSYKLYQEGNFEASFEILHNYLKINFSDQTARFYYAMNAIELNKDELAISELLSLEEDTFSPYSLHAKWYLAMLYLKTGQNNKAKRNLKVLSAGENMYSIRAKEITRKLRI